MGLFSRGNMSYTVVVPSGDQNNLTACLARFKARRVSIIRDSPFSFPNAVNAGIRAADPEDDIVLLSDDVLLIDPDGFDRMEALSKAHPEFGIISACIEGPIINPEQHARTGKDGKIEAWWEVLNPMVATACTYIPRRTINLIGVLDESLDGYGFDDDSYCAAVRQAGLKIAVCGLCRADHGTLHSMYRDGKLFTPEQLEEMSNRNRRHFEKKWHTSWTPSNKMPTYDVIQSMWVKDWPYRNQGSEELRTKDSLDTMGRLTANSFMHQGHPFHLYTYGDVDNIPKGVVKLDANEIVPFSDIKKFNYIAQFSDWFRYNLLLKRGNWWVDMDTVCLRPFVFSDDIVVSKLNHYTDIIPNSPLKIPANSIFIKWIIEEARKEDWSTMEWSTIGPTLMSKAVKKFSLVPKEQSVFMPIPPGIGLEGISKFVDPAGYSIDPATYAVHLHHSRWTIFDNQNVDTRYPETCLYEQWKRRFDVKNLAPGIVDQKPVIGGAWVWRDGKKIQLDINGSILTLA